MKTNYVILLTGSVNPKGMAYTAINDPDTRMKQYMLALQFYLERTTLPIVFCENTMAELSMSFSDIPNINKRFEYITFDGNNFDKSLGKGYGECEIIDYAIRHSKLIKAHPYIIKITGRIIILDIMSYVRAHSSLPKETIQTLLPTKNCFIDSRLIICPKSFFLLLFLPQQKTLNDNLNYYFEHLLYDTITSQNDFFFIPFTTFPNYRGYSGSVGYQYKTYDKTSKLYYSVDATIYHKLKSSPLCSTNIPFILKTKLRAQHFFRFLHLSTLRVFSKIREIV